MRTSIRDVVAAVSLPAGPSSLFAVATAALVSLGLVQLPSGTANGQDLGAHLAAGEFGPAMDLAEKAPGPERDRMLAEVARAQAALGAGRASLGTAGGIADDAARKSMVDFLGGTPVGVPGAAGGRGGAALADFDSLIDLMTSTIAPDSWDEVGGPGAVEPFPGGVLVDVEGVLKRIAFEDADRTLAATRELAQAAHGNGDVRAVAKLRKVSLTQLERAMQLRAARGLAPDATMKNLAGLQKVEYVFVYPDTGDIVIAGPASNWQLDPEGRSVSTETGLLTLQLDDLVVMLRVAQQADPTFGCNITPVRERLAATQAYLNESAKTSLKPGQRGNWLKGIQQTLGKQEIEVFGIDPTTRAARILVEADYRMKLVGMGLEEGVPGVESYLDMVNVGPNGELPPMSVLRWWFTLNYDSLKATPDHAAFAVRGQGVQVLSENELLTKAGERVHTGKSNAPTSQFASSFTSKFGELARKYPIYAELRNVFDLALVAQLIRHQDLASKVDWQMLHFLDEAACPVEHGTSPTQVDTVINHRVVRKVHVIAGVSGGVKADLRQVVSKPIDTKDFGYLKSEYGGAAPPANRDANAWWWD